MLQMESREEEDDDEVLSLDGGILTDDVYLFLLYAC